LYLLSFPGFSYESYGVQPIMPGNHQLAALKLALDQSEPIKTRLPPLLKAGRHRASEPPGCTGRANPRAISQYGILMLTEKNN
jgi:hypothetical protein